MGKMIALCAAVGTIMALQAAVQAKTPQKIPYNPDKQTNSSYALACRFASDLSKAISLNNAKRFDQLPNIGCTIIPEGTEVLKVDKVGSYKQILWEVDGRSRYLWVVETWFKDKLDRAIWDECKDARSTDCHNKVSERFTLEW